ncbi:MAG: hypothetical protein LPK02_07665 [Rhodobacterales bacterium]|nr:hypothetical protein [Rhodobacterales bacterium]
MSTIRPTTTCWIIKNTTRYDGHGRAIHATRRTRTRCAIIHLYDEVNKTTVRADSSATRGRAEEVLAAGRLLLKPSENVATGDLIEIEVKGAQNITLEIKRIFRRMDVGGRVHHIELDGEIWASE